MISDCSPLLTSDGYCNHWINRWLVVANHGQCDWVAELFKQNHGDMASVPLFFCSKIRVVHDFSILISNHLPLSHQKKNHPSFTSNHHLPQIDHHKKQPSSNRHFPPTKDRIAPKNPLVFPASGAASAPRVRRFCVCRLALVQGLGPRMGIAGAVCYHGNCV